MKRFHAHIHIDLSRYLAMLENMVGAVYGAPAPTLANMLAGPPLPKLEDTSKMVEQLLEPLAISCEAAGLDQSAQLIRSSLTHPPNSRDALRILYNQVANEMKRELYLHVPRDRAKFWQASDLVSAKVVEAFPGPASEIRRSGNCYAAGQFTASVFHSMRAAEIGVRAMAAALGVSFSQPIELMEMGSIIERIESVIKDMKQLPRGREKDEDLHFYSQAAAQFRYFKDGWRVRVAHAREVYEEPQALSALNHVREFFEALSARLKEPEDALPPPA